MARTTAAWLLVACLAFAAFSGESVGVLVWRCDRTRTTLTVVVGALSLAQGRRLPHHRDAPTLPMSSCRCPGRCQCRSVSFSGKENSFASSCWPVPCLHYTAALLPPAHPPPPSPPPTTTTRSDDADLDVEAATIPAASGSGIGSAKDREFRAGAETRPFQVGAGV